MCIRDRPFGTLRMKPGGSAGGHNGLKHITELLGTDRYPRLRFGIGHDYPRGKQIEYVLAQFPEGELADMPRLLERTDEMIASFCLIGVEDVYKRQVARDPGEPACHSSRGIQSSVTG